MFSRLFILFALMPIIEIALLIEVGEIIGGWNTILLVLITAALGAHFVRQQGISTLMQAQAKMQQGEMPGQEMAEGILLVVAGVLMVTPGFVTDAIGFAFILPFTRPLLAQKLVKAMEGRVQVHQSGFGPGFGAERPFHQQGFSQQSPFTRGTHADDQDGDIIDGEFVRKEDDNRLN